MTRKGNFVKVIALLDSGLNTSLLSKNAARRLGLSGSVIYLTMNLAGGRKKATRGLLKVPWSNTMYGDRSFSVCAPTLWNSLTDHLRLATDLSSFKHDLKTYLFHESFYYFHFIQNTIHVVPAPQPAAKEVSVFVVLVFI